MMELKKCTKCSVTKPVGEFYLRSERRSNGSRAYRYDCKACCLSRSKEWASRNPKRRLGSVKKYYAANELRVRLQSIASGAKKRGHAACTATLAEIETAFTGKCDICGVPEVECKKKLHIDHCHISGKFRGFLCQMCNHAAGNLHDSPEIALRLAEYLEFHTITLPQETPL